MTGPAVALVTGASRGIGAAVARRLAAAGSAVAVNCSTALAEGRGLVTELAAAGARAELFPADVADAAQVRDMVRRVVDRLGPPSVLVMCAGVNRDAPLLELSEEDWDRVVDVNLKGTFLVAQAIAPHMLAMGRGRIVTVASETAFRGRRNGANYCAAKAGVVTLTRCLALELAPAVQVNVVVPGLIETAETVGRLHLDDPAVRAARLAQIPAGRIGTPDDVAEVVLFLLRDAGDYLTGQTWWVNGGSRM